MIDKWIALYISKMTCLDLPSDTDACDNEMERRNWLLFDRLGWKIAGRGITKGLKEYCLRRTVERFISKIQIELNKDFPASWGVSLEHIVAVAIRTVIYSLCWASEIACQFIVYSEWVMGYWTRLSTDCIVRLALTPPPNSLRNWVRDV